MSEARMHNNDHRTTSTGRLWDFPTRAFHWSLVILIGWEWASSHLGGNWMTYHMWGGYIVLMLIIFRVMWGFIGSTTARFSSFLASPKRTWRYLMTLRGHQHHANPGHNPLGGWAVVAFLLALAIQAGTGLFATDDILNAGPLNALVRNRTADFLTLVHKVNFDILLGLIAVHIVAIALHQVLGGKNLLTPMITGHTSAAAPSMSRAPLAFSRPWVGLMTLGLSAVITWLIIKA